MSMDQDSFANALKRAREIASKIQTDAPGEDEIEPPEKKPFVPDTLDAKKLLAQQIANNLGQKLSKENMSTVQQLYGCASAVGIEYVELEVPKEAVGLVIGKQGETIKRINMETGCAVKFKQPFNTDDDKNRICTFQGTLGQIAKAKSMVQEIIENVKKKLNPGKPTLQPGEELEEIRVSAARAGVVIGKGGENIRQINSLSGAQVVIDKSIPDGANFRVFFVAGTRQQIEHAKFLIREKSGEPIGMPTGPLINLATQIIPPPMPYIEPNIDYSSMGHFPPDQPGWYGTSHDSFQLPYNHNEMGVPPQSQFPEDNYYGNYPPMETRDVNPQMDYSSEWAAYYQQYYSSYGAYPPDGQNQQTDCNGDQNPYQNMDPEYYQAWNQYYQNYYQNYPDGSQVPHPQNDYQPESAQIQPSSDTNSDEINESDNEKVENEDKDLKVGEEDKKEDDEVEKHESEENDNKSDKSNSDDKIPEGSTEN